LRSSDRRGGSARASTSATFLPCSLAPLQSSTAVASRRGPFPGPGRCVCAGQEHIDLGRRTVHPVSVSHPRARRSDGSSRLGRANPTLGREHPNRPQPVSVAVGAEPKLGARCLLARERGDVRPSSRRTAQRRGRSLGVARARLDWASPKPRSGRVERLRAELKQPEPPKRNRSDRPTV
jgi:hypothetical protein